VFFAFTGLIVGAFEVRHAMGILTEAEIKDIDYRMGNYCLPDNHPPLFTCSCIMFIPAMVNGSHTAWFDRMNNVVYFIEDNKFHNCYKKQSKEEFRASVEELKKEGWKFI